MGKKLCFAASSGGHYEQLMMLEPLFKKYDSFIVTEKTDYNIKTPVRMYYMLQVNRKEKKFVVEMIRNVFRAVSKIGRAHV